MAESGIALPLFSSSLCFHVPLKEVASAANCTGEALLAAVGDDYLHFLAADGSFGPRAKQLAAILNGGSTTSKICAWVCVTFSFGIFYFVQRRRLKTRIGNDQILLAEIESTLGDGAKFMAVSEKLLPRLCDRVFVFANEPSKSVGVAFSAWLKNPADFNRLCTLLPPKCSQIDDGNINRAFNEMVDCTKMINHVKLAAGATDRDMSLFLALSRQRIHYGKFSELKALHEALKNELPSQVHAKFPYLQLYDQCMDIFSEKLLAIRNFRKVTNAARNTFTGTAVTDIFDFPGSGTENERIARFIQSFIKHNMFHILDTAAVKLRRGSIPKITEVKSMEGTAGEFIESKRNEGAFFDIKVAGNTPMKRVKLIVDDLNTLISELNRHIGSIILELEKPVKEYLKSPLIPAHLRDVEKDDGMRRLHNELETMERAD
ncbi:MAG: hypothetical protein LBB38_00625 [Puniceicoccales bacterium]|jgi:hypothetical protein|nr:hypothetical protein [Puniceicoccales bacterium]